MGSLRNETYRVAQKATQVACNEPNHIFKYMGLNSKLIYAFYSASEAPVRSLAI